MVQSLRFIILSFTKVGEKSLVLHTLSAEYGRRSFITNAGKGASMSLFLPLNIVDAEIMDNPRSDLWRARSMKAVYPLNGLRSNMFKNAMTMFMSEVLFRTIKDGANEDSLFEWCEKSILTLDAIEGDFSNFHLRFLLEFAGALGFSPSAEDVLPFAGDNAGAVTSLIRSSFAESMLIPLNGSQRSDIADSLLRYLSHHCESSINVRSLKVLGELFR